GVARTRIITRTWSGRMSAVMSPPPLLGASVPDPCCGTPGPGDRPEFPARPPEPDRARSELSGREPPAPPPPPPPLPAAPPPPPGEAPPPPPPPPPPAPRPPAAP